jgi:LacI family transcriptional regulator
VTTLKDVAALAGVGVGTASRVISGNGPVSASAVARVKAAIETLNFRPSSIGRAMVSQSLGIIGIFVPTFVGSFYGTILRQADIELRAVGRHIVVATGFGGLSPRDQAIHAVEFLIGRDCDGIAVVSQDLCDEDLTMLHQMHPRMVFLNRTFDEVPEASFCVDHRKGGALAARTLVEAGHRQIAVISRPSGAQDIDTRLNGFMEGLERNGVKRDAVYVIESDCSSKGGYDSAKALLESKTRFTGLFCVNDQMAIGALAYLHQAGVSVPGDVSVVGYDDDDDSGVYATPALTSVHIPIGQLTQHAVRWLINECYGTSSTIVRDFEVSVTKRSSVGTVAKR